MSQLLNSNLTLLLRGESLDSDEDRLCDFTIAEQNSVAESQGITPTTPSNYKPVLGVNVTYVVACVIINNNDEVLMMQEAKESCAGKWYLPAGRMEANESIVDATIREVLEETGLNCRPRTLLAVETAGGSWFRFVLTGDVIGGELKTPAKADQESLQAKWIGDLKEISLRSNDIVHLVDRAKSYYKRGSDKSWHTEVLPADITHSKNLLRLVVIIKKRSTNRAHVLLSEKTALHFPTCEINPGKNVHSTLRRFMVEMFGADVAQHKPLGLLSVEHNPSGQGCCLTLLVAFRAPLEEVPIIGKCVWQEIAKEIEDKMIPMINSKNATIPLHVVR